MTRRGHFITFEGPEGSGKSTQLRLLAEALRARSLDVVETQEPGGTLIGRQIRQILLDRENGNLKPTTELLLMFASRAQNVDECILPALAAGKVVLCDRFTDSSLAYQGSARGLGEEAIQDLDRIACRGLTPGLTLLIDIDAETGLARARARNDQEQAGDTRMEDLSIGFHRTVREAYRRLASDDMTRIRTIDGSRSKEEVARDIWQETARFLGLTN